MSAMLAGIFRRTTKMMLPPDKIERIEDARIQHGPLNQRIYLMQVGSSDLGRLISRMERLAAEQAYTKIFAKVPATKSDAFFNVGYVQEASVPRFFRGREDALFLCKYFHDSRRQENQPATLNLIQNLALQTKPDGSKEASAVLYNVRPCGPDDALEMSELYARVFPSYPFPIDCPDYILETMISHIDYFGVECRGNLIALSSAEMDREEKNVEMTDFATLPEWEGRGLGRHLLAAMETTVRQRGIQTAYTIARAASAGINIIFARRGYRFSGRLVNNTNISGCIESMNVWYKSL